MFSSCLGEARIFDIARTPSFPRSEGTREQRGEKTPAGTPGSPRSSAGAGPSPAAAPGLGLGLGFGPITDKGLRGNLLPYSAFIYLGLFLLFFTAPVVYLAVHFPWGQFAVPKRSSRFESNTANKISMTLITPCMNISFT